jgi:sugar/nucleoside kinase (ribokinase family)
MSQPTYDVLSYGTIGIDRILRVPHLPSPDISTHAWDESIHLGGKATNSAAFLATWGLDVAVCGTTIGYDDTGETLIAILTKHPRISTQYLGRKRDLHSMYCCILVTPDGERAIIGVHADENVPTPPTAGMVEDARLLTLDLYGGKERVEAARLARLAGRPVVAGDVRDPDHPVLPYTTVAIASGPELKAGTTLLPEEFARAAQAVGTGQVIVTQGKREVLVFDADGAIWEVQPPHIEVVDTTGAGDAFRAGVIFGLLSGRPLVECAALGASAGSINVGRVGAASNPPSLEEAESLAAKLECRRV